jgi:hypothetical protein
LTTKTNCAPGDNSGTAFVPLFSAESLSTAVVVSLAASETEAEPSPAAPGSLMATTSGSPLSTFESISDRKKHTSGMTRKFSITCIFYQEQTLRWEIIDAKTASKKIIFIFEILPINLQSTACQH